jgi:hypothetical protein
MNNRDFVLLAAIRDVLEKNMKQDDRVDDIACIRLINQILFLASIRLQSWIHDPCQQLEEGTELDFARLVQTCCDGMACYAAVLPRCEKIIAMNMGSSSSRRPLDARAYFLQALGARFPISEQLNCILQTVLNHMSVSYFPVDVHKGRNDGTEDLMVIYERLALRDATFSKPSRADMFRKLLLGCFDRPDEALEFFKDHWLPTEQQAEGKNAPMKDLISYFLDTRYDHPNEISEALRNVKLGILVGRVYAVSGMVHGATRQI